MIASISPTSDVALWTLSWIRNAPVYKDRVEFLLAALQASRVDGLFCEFGVYTGSSLRFIADRIHPLVIHGFDSFQGLPEQAPEMRRPNWPAGAFAAEPLRDVPKNARLHRGLFEDTLPTFVRDHPGPASFLHCDADVYSSTKTVLDCMQPKIVRGTVLAFDEFLWWDGWERKGEARAWAEFVERTGLEFECLGTIESPNEQVAVRIR